MSQMLPSELSARVTRLSDETLMLVVDAFRAGVREGTDAARDRVVQQLGAYCQSLLTELEGHHDSIATPEDVTFFHELYLSAPKSPIVAAHFGAAADAIERVKAKLRRLGWRGGA